jgi:septal ring factor EnvC (AmiA/AmiB activator)
MHGLLLASLILSGLSLQIILACPLLAQNPINDISEDEEHSEVEVDQKNETFLKYQAKYQSQIEKSLVIRTLHQKIYEIIQAENQITQSLKTISENLNQAQKEIDEINTKIVKLKSKINEQLIAYQGLKREQLWTYLLQNGGDLSRKEFYLSAFFDQSIILLNQLKQLQKKGEMQKKSLAQAFEQQKEQEQLLEKEKKELLAIRQKEMFLLKIKDAPDFITTQSLPPMIGSWQKVYQTIDQEEILQGIHIQAQASKETVHSILDGQVLFAQKVKGLGFVVVISHQDQFQSLYSGLSEILVKKGEKLKLQEKLGMVKTGELLYFELKKAWVNIDPHRLLLELTEISQSQK